MHPSPKFFRSHVLKVCVQKSFESLQLDIRLEADAGGITVLRGESGAGKTTIAHMICGLVTPDAGEIELEDQVVYSSERSVNLPPESRGIGCVFQTPRLFPNMTVRENILFPTKFGRRKPKLDLSECTAILGLEKLLDRSTYSLSGGEAQRVSIGRALMAAERLLILDEPLASLDPPRRRQLIDFILKAARALDVPVLCITHSDDEMRRLAVPPGMALLLSDGRLSPIALGSAGSAQS